MSKQYTLLLLLLLPTASASAQRNNYIGYEQALAQFVPSVINLSNAELSGSLNRCELSYMGGFYNTRLDNKFMVTIGAGLGRIDYQKEFQGIFPESNQFGVARIDGKLDYWSFPLSFGSSPNSGRHRYFNADRSRYRFGWSITYTPSFIARNSFTISTSGGANSSSSPGTFKSNEQAFQHSLTVGLSSQAYFADHLFRLGIEPYAGIGSSYFKEQGSRCDNLIYGVRLKIGLRARMPHISIEKEAQPVNSQQKKNELLQKQKEIEEQLNKQPK